MNDQKNQQQRQEGAGEQNPTLNRPGSDVADYGNTTGGSAVEKAGQQGSNPQRAGTGNNEQSESDETIGNP